MDRPCPRIKTVRYHFTHRSKVFSTVSSPGKRSLAVSELPHTHNQSPAHHHEHLTSVSFILCRWLRAHLHHLVTMVFQFVLRLA